MAEPKENSDTDKDLSDIPSDFDQSKHEDILGNESWNVGIG
jgi:hypothetical protein